MALLFTLVCVITLLRQSNQGLIPGVTYADESSDSDFPMVDGSAPWYKRYEEVKDNKNIPQLPGHKFEIPFNRRGFRISLPSKCSKILVRLGVG